MEVLIERCCGLDVHKETVVACLMTGSGRGRAQKETRTFGTTTSELEELRAWLLEAGCSHVGMESTGVYWMPVFAVLEGHFELIVGNAAHIKNVPGRKTDVKDAQWLADLVRHGLIRKSFVPPKWQRALRDLIRYRRKLVEAQTAERNRLQRLLETCNIKLAAVRPGDDPRAHRGSCISRGHGAAGEGGPQEEGRATCAGPAWQRRRTPPLHAADSARPG